MASDASYLSFYIDCIVFSALKDGHEIIVIELRLRKNKVSKKRRKKSFRGFGRSCEGGRLPAGGARRALKGVLGGRKREINLE